MEFAQCYISGEREERRSETKKLIHQAVWNHDEKVRKNFSIICPQLTPFSFFGEQEGQFSLQIESITAICLDANAQPVENVQEKRNTDGPATTSSESSTEPFEDVLQVGAISTA